MAFMLETRGLTKQFGRGDCAQTAVASVNLHIKEGEVYGLLGPNGAGKSTTLKMICGMLRPSAGQILIDGHPWQRDDLYRIRVERNDLDHIIRTILRLYNGIFIDFRPIDEQQIASVSGYTVTHVKELLKRMWQMRIIRYIPSNRSAILFFDEERLPTKDVYISPDTYLRRKQLMTERFENMLRYAENSDTCRSVILQSYFGDDQAHDCGVCDICLDRRRRARAAAGSASQDTDVDTALRRTIIEALKQTSATGKELCRNINTDPARVAAVIEALLAEGKISTTASGKLVLIE